MNNYFLTFKAKDDLSEIWEYTYDNWTEDQADKYYELLINSFRETAENPELGKIYKEIDSSILGFRVAKHIIFYRRNSFREIEVLRILHQRMDLKARINE